MSQEPALLQSVNGWMDEWTDGQTHGVLRSWAEHSANPICKVERTEVSPSYKYLQNVSEEDV